MINTNILSSICGVIKSNDLGKEKFEEFYELCKEIFTEHHLSNITLMNFYLSISLHNKCDDIFDEIKEVTKDYDNNVVRNNLIIKKLLNEEKYDECF